MTVFRHRGQLSLPLFSLFLVLNALVFYNALFHDPRIGYDTSAYLDYIRSFSEGRLPTSTDTQEFFSPPLAFVPPAVVYAALRPLSGTDLPAAPASEFWVANFLHARFLYSIDDFALALSAKFSQLTNVLYSVVLSYYLLKICDLIRPGNIRLKFLTLLLLLMLPVYFKTFAFVRTEPLLVMIVVTAFYYLFSAFHQGAFKVSNALLLGLLAGLGMLTRQWFLSAFISLFIALGLLAHRQGVPWRRILGLVTIYGSVAFFVSTPFYLHLNSSEGSPLAFNRSLSLSSLRSSWAEYFGLDLGRLFRDPLRSTFGLQILPILYSDTWGDYWGYFVFYAREKQTGRYLEGLYADSERISPEKVASGELRFETNRFTINAYLGRVNAVSMVPSAVLFAGFLIGLTELWKLRRRTLQDQGSALIILLTLLVIVSVLIYFVFLLGYTHDSPTTIKTTYLIHIVPFLALLGGEALVRLEIRNNKAFKALLVVLVLVFLHNIPALLTRHIL